MTTATPEHPHVDGRPVLIGEWLHAVDADCSDTITGSDTFQMDGRVTLISGDMVTLQPVKGLTEEFYLDTEATTLTRIDPPDDSDD